MANHDTNNSGNAHMGHRQRLKQRFVKEGLDSFEPHQAIELLLFYAVPQRDTNELAHKLIKEFGSLSKLLEANPVDIAKRCNISENTAILLSMMPQLFRIYSKDAMRERDVLSTSAAAGEYAKCLFTGRIYEVFYMISLDKNNRVMMDELLCEGTIDEVPCYPRRVIETALRHNAHRVIFAHNHPSGRCMPSTADVESTKKLAGVLGEIDITVVDHIIVGNDGYLSMADVGYIRGTGI